MSAFLCSSTHLSMLVNVDKYVDAATSFPFSEYFARYNAGAPSTDEGIYNMLAQANAESLAERYGEKANVVCSMSQLAGLYSTASAPSGAALLKLIDSYEYQSCESAGWDTSLAKKYCERLRREVIAMLPGYRAAEWAV